ncbi:hypothetical protein DP107_09180 [Haloglomus irregulare]|uniref:Uncharacterized protein n=1 Tax=Haloglomus irregulare TaxID=2234134 RepID=A0A554NAM4_9EURY|nr:hypothetical protein DP107_09180 [Haloglomus irregulare]
MPGSRRLVNEVGSITPAANPISASRVRSEGSRTTTMAAAPSVFNSAMTSPPTKTCTSGSGPTRETNGSAGVLMAPSHGLGA